MPTPGGPQGDYEPTPFSADGDEAGTSGEGGRADAAAPDVDNVKASQRSMFTSFSVFKSFTAARRSGKSSGKKRLARQATHPLPLLAARTMFKSRKLASTVVEDPETPDAVSQPSVPALLAPAASGLGGAGAGGDSPNVRTVPLAGGAEAPGFCGNMVTTAKYNVATFLPKFLFETFSRAAYLYFLGLALLAWFPPVSPYGGMGMTLALSFVVLTGALKAVVEDYKRHVEDRRANASKTHLLLPDGLAKDVRWKDVRVGHLLLIRDDELVPADCLLLYCHRPENVCFTKTANLDGESNLKVRRAVEAGSGLLKGPSDVVGLEGQLSVEPPCANLHAFKGRFSHVDGNGQPVHAAVTMNEVLLRGCLLKNSHYVVGLVIYTGDDTRIQRNSAPAPRKCGAYDLFLNLQISLIIGLQFAMCLGSTLASKWWQLSRGPRHWYLGWSAAGVRDNLLYTSAIEFLNFWILYSYLVPINLFVMTEVVRFIQGLFINMDTDMLDKSQNVFARTRNSDVNEDLGLVRYVFSDKTGTLTSNEMRLRCLAIKGMSYGDAKFRLEAHPELRSMEACVRFDSRLAEAAIKAMERRRAYEAALQAGGSGKALLAAGAASVAASGGGRAAADPVAAGHHALDFFFNLCVCHSLIVEPQPDYPGEPMYQGPSPDEVALVEAARQLGFEFVSRSQDHVALAFQGTRVELRVLNIIEYSSERGRMSVVARAPDGTIRLYCKGADTKVLELLREDIPQELLQSTHRNLHLYATQGLRTLVLGTRVLSHEEWAAWDARWQQAVASLDDRDAAMAAAATEVECGLELVGVTAIEDKLQDGVPETIASLLDAGIKVWMITGDKQETAINIGVSCKLVRNPESLEVCNSSTRSGAAVQLRELLNRMIETEALAKEVGGAPNHGELVIDGPTLGLILGTDQEPVLAEVGSRVGSAIICRASPAQKAAVVSLMTRHELKTAQRGARGLVGALRRYMRRMQVKSVAIGDGANDVAMIQTADIGVGIMGKEGRQAVNNADFALGQFRFLVRLLLVHGTLCKYRLARLIKYSFYKNCCFAFMVLASQTVSWASGKAIIDGITAMMYNVIFTGGPIVVYALVDRPVRYYSTLIVYPQLYNRQRSLTFFGFWRSAVLYGMAHGAVIFSVMYFALQPDGIKSTTDLYSQGFACLVALLGVITIELAIVTRYWTWAAFLVYTVSYGAVYLYIGLYPLFAHTQDPPAPQWFGVPWQLLSQPQFWFGLLSVYAITGGHRLAQRTLLALYRPQDAHIVAEREDMYGARLGEMSWQAASRVTSLTPASPEPSATAGPGRSFVSASALSEEVARVASQENPSDMRAGHHRRRSSLIDSLRGKGTPYQSFVDTDADTHDPLAMSSIFSDADSDASGDVWAVAELERLYPPAPQDEAVGTQIPTSPTDALTRSSDEDGSESEGSESMQ